MRGILVFLVCVTSLAVAQQSIAEQPLVTAPIGKIRGSILTSRLGKEIYSFRGIRYGEPPVGSQRFQPPIPAKDWQNVFDATEEGPSCPHANGIQQSEDCLRLNVYTTKLPCRNEDVSRPVMIFIHPGGFNGFSGQSINFGPQYLLDKDIVLVTINYRLGTLGFLNTGDSAAPGNMGLKDQVAAFHWVQRNIAAFGGNPNSVTLCGYSAGSFSIMLHLVSPMSRNLFHRAIAMSSSAIKLNVYSGISQHGQMQLAQRQARLLDCPTDSTSAMVRCFRSKPTENFTDTLRDLYDWRGNPIVLWSPAVEPAVPGVERFLSEQPYDAIKQGRFYQVPLMMGVTEDEFGGIAALYENATLRGNSLYPELNDNWNTLAPIIFMYERNTSRSNYVSRELRKFYFNDQPINSASYRKLGDIYGDAITKFPMYRAIKLFATYSKLPVYFYKFSFQGRYSFYMLNATTPYGVCHHDDLQYLFFIKSRFPYFNSDAPEIPMVEISTSIWSNFVINGEPIRKHDGQLRNVRWGRLVPEHSNFLELNLHPSIKTEFFPERMREWERLFPAPSTSPKMRGIPVFLLCITGLAIAQQSTAEQPLVTAPIGKIRGSILTSRLGKEIYSFRGIRYGEPPVGSQRFQPPIPAKDWQNVFDATEEGPSCPQPNGTLVSEDCLRLNVYTTKLPCKSENVSKPVMIFIHPGGFYSFSGQSIHFGPQYLLDKDIVLVTINYRLGALGFLSTGDSAAPGNMGLKDQVAAFRWVQRNIAAFGGNPHSVTLCGYSAGSFSIMLHLVSPMSRNLFHRAITMSSSAIGLDVYSGISQHGQTQLVQKQARLLNCSTDSTSAMVDCLRSKPVENFIVTLGSLFDWYATPILLWTPAVEPEVPGVERFLSEQPYDAIKQGRFYQVPLMMGVTEDEFAGIVAYYENATQEGNSVYPELNDNWNTLAPIVFMYERNTSRSNYISRELRKFYFNDQPINSANSKELGDIYCDSIITFPMYRAIKLFATYSKLPVYFYKFSFQGRYSFYMLNATTPYGVCHHDDLQYLFFIKSRFPYFNSDAPEIPMVEISTSIWSNFVINGEPIPKHDSQLRNVRWDKFVPEQNNFLELNLHPSIKTEFFPERMREWERLFPEPSVRNTVKH
ncbi:uncharacterized protein [Bombus flavifrons]|uniref:uncharacterized protein n=1 Tax=Bombus flavifrons TaxID=103934 RepID=UPI003704683E